MNGTPDRFHDPHSRASDAPADGVLFDSPGGPGPDSGLTVLGLAGDATACGNYRVKYPLMALARRGAKVRVRLLVPDPPVPMDEALSAHVIFVQREPSPELLRALKSVTRVTGAALVYDLDDYLHGVPEANPASAIYSPRTADGRAVRAGIDRWIAEADAVTFSTRELASLYGRPDGYVLPNGLDCALGDRDWDSAGEDWKDVAARQGCSPGADSLLVGMSGGATHRADWRLLGPSLRRVLEDPRAYVGLQTNGELARSLFREWGLPEGRTVFLPSTQFGDYPPSLTAFDVCLAPLAYSRFSLAKSALRLLEFGAQGVPYVASRVAPFHRHHRESGGVGGALAAGEDFAGPALKMLADDAGRLAMGRAARGFVRSQCLVDGAAWSHAFRSALARRRGGWSVPSLLSLSDSARGIPDRPRFPAHAQDPCPCGCGSAYGRSPCVPAYGRL